MKYVPATSKLIVDEEEKPEKKTEEPKDDIADSKQEVPEKVDVVPINGEEPIKKVEEADIQQSKV